MEKKTRKVNVLIFHDELCQVFNGLMTALSLLREGAEVTVFFGSRGINTVHKKKVKELKCLPDQPEEIQKAVMDKMEELWLPTAEDMLETLRLEGAKLLACPLNKEIFEFKDIDFVKGVKVADPQTYYKDELMKSDYVLSF